MVDLYSDPAAVWSQWADDVADACIESGHHVAEEAPEELTGHVLGFLAAAPA